MRLLILIAALTWQGSQAMAALCNATSRLNGFDLVGACVGASEIALISSMHPIVGNVVPFADINFGATVLVEGDNFGLINTVNTGIAGTALTITAANFAGGVGTDFTAYRFFGYAQATTRAATASFVAELAFTNASVNYVFNGQQAVRKSTGANALTDWTYQVLSLNYARNLNLPLTAIDSVSARWRSTAGAQPFTMAYDDMVAVAAGNIANTPLSGTAVAIVTACTPHNITLTPQAQSGDDPITGYHVYRSTSGDGGPYLSHRYINSAPWAFTENPPYYSNVHYKILPYSGTTTNFNGTGVPGIFARASNTVMDPVNSQILAGGGVHEALLSAATAIGPYDQLAACPATPTPTSSPTPTVTPTATPSPTNSPTPSHTPTSTETPTATPSFTAVPPGASATHTPVVPPAATATPAPPTLTFTITPTFTASPVGPTAQLYPNPFNPDREPYFYLGNVPAGAMMSIYNLIGERVYNLRLQGNPNFDKWDGLNNNGIRVVTGIYFVVIEGDVYRLAVVRD